MKPVANGTHAKDIALYFLREIGADMKPNTVGRTIAQAKRILEKGYTKEEIISVIDEIIRRGVKMYSIGFVEVSIGDVLAEIREEKQAKEVKKNINEEIKALQEKTRAKVRSDEASKERNRRKAERFGSQSRFREKFNLDMFEE